MRLTASTTTLPFVSLRVLLGAVSTLYKRSTFLFAIPSWADLCMDWGTEDWIISGHPPGHLATTSGFVSGAVNNFPQSAIIASTLAISFVLAVGTGCRCSTLHFTTHHRSKSLPVADTPVR